MLLFIILRNSEVTTFCSQLINRSISNDFQTITIRGDTMNENVIAWITKISESYAECICGEVCHVNVTIRHDMLLFRVICPECGRGYSVAESMSLIKAAPFDLTDELLDRVKNEFKALGSKVMAP